MFFLYYFDGRGRSLNDKYQEGQPKVTFLLKGRVTLSDPVFQIFKLCSLVKFSLSLSF